MAETSFKFFIQFLLYGTLFAGYTLITMAVFVAELARMVSLVDFSICFVSLSQEANRSSK